jgi:hypothetical protein
MGLESSGCTENCKEFLIFGDGSSARGLFLGTVITNSREINDIVTPPLA